MEWWLVYKTRPACIREICRRIFSMDRSSIATRSLRSASFGKRLSPIKKKERKSENWKPIKDKYSSNHFPFPNLKYWKFVCIQRNCKCSISPIVKFIEWTLLHASVQRLRHFYSSKRKRKRKKRTVERHFCLFSCWLNIAVFFLKKREKKKELFLKSHYYLFDRRILKFCYLLNASLCWNVLIVFFPLLIWLLCHISCLGLIPLSLILAKRLIASLNIARGFGNLSTVNII